MAFEVRERNGGRVLAVYAVHKSSPRDEDTKFLIHDAGAWRWVRAINYAPHVASPMREASPTPQPIAPTRV